MKKTYMGKIWTNKKASFAFKIVHTSNKPLEYGATQFMLLPDLSFTILYHLPEEKEKGNTYIVAFAWGFRIIEFWFGKKGQLKDLI
jgi:hypothetical protein